MCASADAARPFIDSNISESFMSDEQLLRRLNVEYVQASLTGDVDWYRVHLADDFS